MSARTRFAVDARAARNIDRIRRHAVVHDIDLTVQAGEIVTLVGANGAGKTTLVKTISGLLRAHQRPDPVRGAADRDAFGARSGDCWGLRTCRKGRQTFAGLTVAENLELGASFCTASGREAIPITAHAGGLRAFSGAASSGLHEVVANFSGGQHQMLAIARGLMASPKLLVLDEPSLGLSPVLVSQIFQLIASLRDRGMAILLSEQNARLSLAIADRGYVIENGRVAISGRGRELLRSSDIAERYLGVGAALGKIDTTRGDKLAASLRELMRYRADG